MGEFLVDGGISLVSGRNAMKAGQRIVLSRDSQEVPAKLTLSKKDTKSKGKQTTLNVFISQSVKAQKTSKKPDHIVRFTSLEGIQLGRLPVATAEFVSVLMDNGLVRFAGNVVEPPETGRVGDSVLLSLRAYLNAGAFNRPNLPNETVSMLREGSETATEKILRERKESLVKLFDMVGLKPRTVAPITKINGAELVKDTTKGDSKVHGNVKMEVIGEGEDAEEVEVEDDGEELDEQDIDLIYKK